MSAVPAVTILENVSRDALLGHAVAVITTTTPMRELNPSQSGDTPLLFPPRG